MVKPPTKDEKIEALPQHCKLHLVRAAEYLPHLMRGHGSLRELTTIAEIQRAKKIRQSIAQAIRDGTASAEDYGLDEHGLIAVGAVLTDNTRLVMALESK